MQPQYETFVWSDQFCEDITAICGSVRAFVDIFTGHYWHLSRLPRQDTWDLSPTGDLRLAYIDSGRSSDGTIVPRIYFTFQLHLGSAPSLELLRAYRADDPELLAFLAALPPSLP